WGAAEALSLQDAILATLLGAAIYMIVIEWTAMLPVHYPLVHMAALALPLLIWPRTLRACVQSLGALVQPAEWDSRWHYFAFALAAFIPLTLLIGAVLLPQVNSDATVLHLAVTSNVAINHFWSYDFRQSVFAVVPLGISWMTLPSYLLGGEVAARLVNFCFF